jgi:DNA (cytosine-5)-methyltransferase 1
VKFLSVCSGIEAASVAWNPLGWEAVAFSEIDPFPCALLAHRYPHVPNLGDMTKFREWPDDLNPDLLCGGTPCQSYSNAGLRKGLADPRGNLMLTFAAIAAKYRPRWLVWENVPGVLSSNNGRDFAAFLGLLTGQHVEPPAGGWGKSGFLSGIADAYGVAYRVLDAQYAGLAQRRERVFVIGYLGDWRPAAAVLLERHSLCGDPAPSRGARQGATDRADERIDAGGGCVARLDLIPEVSGVLGGSSQSGGFRTTDLDNNGAWIPVETAVQVFGGNNTAGPIDVAPACRAHGTFHYDFESEAFLTGAAPMAIPLQEVGKRTGISTTDIRAGIGIGEDGDPAYTLQAGAQHGVATPMVFQERGREGGRVVEVGGEVAYALTAPAGGGRHSEMNVLAPIGFQAEMSGTQVATAQPTSPTLGAKNRMAVAFKASHFTRGKDGAPNELVPALSADADKGDQDSLVLAPYNTGDSHGSSKEAGPIEALRALQAAIGEEAFYWWSVGVNDSLRAPQVLRPDVHGGSVRREASEGKRGMGDCALSREEDMPAGPMREMHEAGRERRAPQGRGLAEQFARELDAALQELPPQGAQPAWLVQCLRRRGEGPGLLQPPLHPVPRGETPAMAVRRFTPLECELLQGFPPHYTLVPYRPRRAKDFDAWFAYLAARVKGLTEEQALQLAADGPRYKAIGNSWAIPCVRWLGERIEMVENALGGAAKD